MLLFFQYLDNGAHGHPGQNVVPHVDEVSGNVPGFATIRLRLITVRVAKGIQWKRKLVTKYVRPWMENGPRGLHGPHAVRIVYNSGDGIVAILNRPMVDGTVKATN